MDFAPVDSAVDGPLRVVAVRCATPGDAAAIRDLLVAIDASTSYGLPAARVTRGGRRPDVRPALVEPSERTLYTVAAIAACLGALAGIPIGPVAAPINAAVAAGAAWYITRAALLRAAMAPLRVDVLSTAGWVLEAGEELLVAALEREAAAVFVADARTHVPALAVVELDQKDQHLLRERLTEQQ